MLRFSIRLAVYLIPVFNVMSLTLILLGSAQPPHAALRGFVEGCASVPQPCWYGIVPGVTSLEDAQAFLDDATTYTFSSKRTLNITHYWRYEASGLCALTLVEFNAIVREIGLRCREVKVVVGEVYAVVGTPNFVMPDLENIYLYHPGQGIFYITTGGMSDDGLMLVGVENEIRSLALRSEAPRGLDGFTFAWHGFIPFWRLCQLEPHNELCS
jgi:hypothetical protein